MLPEGSAPAKAGVFELKGDQVTVALRPGATGRIGGKPVSGAAAMRPDTSGSPDVLEMGTLSLNVIKRGDRYGIRLKDKNSPVRKGFTGLRWFEIQEAYRVEARWVSYPQPKPVKVPNVLGQTESMPSPGYAEFTLSGKPVRLDGVLEDPHAEQLFFILRDQTSGKETYGAGPLPLRGPAEGRQGRARLQQGLQPALRLHAVRHLPAASAAELDARAGRGRRAGYGKGRHPARSGRARDLESPVEGPSKPRRSPPGR